MAVTTAIAAVASAGAAISSSQDMHSMAHQAAGQGGVIFAEQQEYAKQLDDLMRNPDKVTQLPTYDFMLKQGTENLSRSMGAAGFHNSGNMAAGIFSWGADYAKSAWKDQIGVLAGLSGLQTQSPDSYNRTAMSGNAQSFDQLGQGLAALGYAGKTLGNAGSSGGIMANSPMWSNLFSLNAAGSGAVPGGQYLP